MTAAEVVPYIGVLFGSTSVVALLLVRSQKKKLNAETDRSKADYVQIISGTAISLLGPMREQLDALTAQLMAANAEIAELRVALGSISRDVQNGN